ncbi:hypothetical protein MTR_7g035145 [Medicago truncatula]|uniref:Uncharacterized protein n=1 Tax=Medicago truncatula TaxID=3880 RepID=A0A072TZE1_MEDTR|nr:hypothetical protein MTR_7g035145 [Medicago truncatula]
MISHRLIWEHFWFLGYESDGSSQRLRIREQLEQLVGERDDDFSLPIGKNFKERAFGLLPARNRKSVRLKKQITEKAATRNPIYLRY